MLNVTYREKPKQQGNGRLMGWVFASILWCRSCASMNHILYLPCIIAERIHPCYMLALFYYQVLSYLIAAIIPDYTVCNFVDNSFI